jgi:hypothetical protein
MSKGKAIIMKAAKGGKKGGQSQAAGQKSGSTKC